MKRLTQNLNGQKVAKFDIRNYDVDNKVSWIEYSRGQFSSSSARYLTGEIAEKLFMYEELEESGRLLFLPAKQSILVKLLAKALTAAIGV